MPNLIFLDSITPQNAYSTVLGIVSDRDVAFPTPAGSFTSRANFNTTYFGQNISDKVFGSSGPTGLQTWGQGTTYSAVGVMIELLPATTAPLVAVAFNPSTIITGNTSTLTFSISNPNAAPLTNANFTDMLAGMSVASTTIGGTCAGVTNSPALGIGATALNLTIPSLPVGGCTIALQVAAAGIGVYPNTASGVTTTQTTTAGAGSNTATLTVSGMAQPATIAIAFTPAWIAQGGSSTLTFSLASPSNVALSNATFTDTLSNMTIASTAIGGTCIGVSNTPALTVDASALNLKVPTLPATGCTVTVQVTSAFMGSNANVTSGVTSVGTSSAGAVSNTAYLTVGVADVGFSYVHADHLGTPRAITRPSDNAVVWKWENSDPFGANAPNEDPANTGTAFKYNLRFPGQYYDQETQTHYNYFRDYDPATGRYVQSDPIGLKGGINTYGYVSQQPLHYADPKGLVKWEAIGFSGSYGPTVAGGLDVYTLKSECKCGKRVTIGLAALYAVIGKGPLPISGSVGDATFIDGQACPSADSAKGLYAKMSASAVYGYGYSVGLTRLGKLTSSSILSDAWGLDIGFSPLALGRTKVTFEFEEKCDECNK